MKQNKPNQYLNKIFTPERQYDKADKERFKIISDLVGSGKRVLDVGCFTGDLGKILIDQRNDVYGLDISIAAISQSVLKGIKVKACNLEERFPFRDNYFDVVVAGEVIEHIRDTDFFIEEIRKVLRPNGYLILSTPNLVSLGRRISYLFGKEGFHEASYTFPSSAGGDLHYFNLSLLKSFLMHHEFKVVKVSSDVVNFYYRNMIQSKILAKVFPTFGRSLIVKAIKF